MGYRLLFAYTVQQWDMQITTSLDKEAYNEQDLITLKVPLSLPYLTDWKDFERVDGEITINGQLYKYVKRKIVHGELVLMCLPDTHKEKLETAKDDFFTQANNLRATSPTKKTTNTSLLAFSNISWEYDDQQQDWLQHLFCNELQPDYFLKEYRLLTRSLTTPEQPPDTGKA